MSDEFPLGETELQQVQRIADQRAESVEKAWHRVSLQAERICKLEKEVAELRVKLDLLNRNTTVRRNGDSVGL